MGRAAVSAPPAQRFLPSGRSLAVGFALLAAAGALYIGALRTSVFAVREVTVQSVPPSQSRIVERTLADLKGSSLLEVDSTRIQRRLERLPHVHLLAYDRAFPNELRIRVSVERAVAVLRRGSDRWLLSAEGRVLRRLERPLRRPLPVVWGERSLEPEIGVLLEAPEAAQAVDAVAAMQRVSPALARRVWHVETEDGKLTAILHDRFEVRLGSSAELDLKIAVASRVVPALASGEAAYADVSVPERPVVGTTLESQIEP